MTKDNILSHFPKTRPELPEAYQEIYVESYKKNRSGVTRGTIVSSKMEQWMHYKVASDLTPMNKDLLTLEVGAGTLNHLKFEESVSQYDVVEPFRDLYEDSIFKKRVRNFYDDIYDVPPIFYDRIISIATFEHICDLPQLVARCIKLLKQGGELRVAIPAEGGPLWTLGWKLTTGLEFKMNYKLDYSVLMQYEHVNPWWDIRDILNYFFEEVESQFFGFSPCLSLYQFYSCKLPNLIKAKEVLIEPQRYLLELS